MKKLFSSIVAAALVLAAASFARAATPAAADGSRILEFQSMVGVPRPYTGAANAIRGVPGGGLPWVIGSASGELKADGKLEIKVQGLVLDPNDPVVISRGTGGTNPSPTFRAIVSCLSRDADGNPTTVNVTTDPFPADPQGNAEIEATVSLPPSPCIAPIIFVTSGAGSWFASTGF